MNTIIERHTFVGTFDDGSQIYIEELVLPDGTREMSAATRRDHHSLWGIPAELEATS